MEQEQEREKKPPDIWLGKNRQEEETERDWERKEEGEDIKMLSGQQLWTGQSRERRKRYALGEGSEPSTEGGIWFESDSHKHDGGEHDKNAEGIEGMTGNNISGHNITHFDIPSGNGNNPTASSTSSSMSAMTTTAAPINTLPTAVPDPAVIPMGAPSSSIARPVSSNIIVTERELDRSDDSESDGDTLYDQEDAHDRSPTPRPRKRSTPELADSELGTDQTRLRQEPHGREQMQEVRPRRRTEDWGLGFAGD